MIVTPTLGCCTVFVDRNVAASVVVRFLDAASDSVIFPCFTSRTIIEASSKGTPENATQNATQPAAATSRREMPMAGAICENGPECQELAMAGSSRQEEHYPRQDSNL